MSLAAGTRLGSYEIVGSLGAGGMGEVYRARDTKLGRDVALKILPALFASDADRLARFEREARTLAGLNHPNIAAIYGIEDGGPTRALVMELVDGEDLSARIARGPVAVVDALHIASQIALALEAAHDAGVIHRDLKPANVKVRNDGTVKVLDFGLAKALDPTQASGSTAQAHESPTLTARATQMGMIIGTAAYMAPEQARGKAVDRRADIWAFGIVLYEMLTGRRAFEGEEISDVLAAVLRQDLDWTALPADTPASVRRLLRRCLEKDPKRRLSAIGDARLEIEETGDEPARPSAAPARQSRTPMLIGAAAGALLTAAIAATLWVSAPRAPVAGVTRLSIVPPEDRAFYSDPAEHVISPDGRMVAFVIGDKTSFTASQIWIRNLDTLAARRLPGGDGGHMPFWSPDSRRVGFFTDRKLKTAAVDSDRADVLCDAASGRGGTWSRDNVIVFAPDGAGALFKVSANGGDPTPVTALDKSKQEVGHRFPTFLPDGNHFLFAALPGRGGKFNIFAGSLSGGAPELIGQMETSPAYAEPGWLIFMRQGALAAQPFDAARRQLTGEAVALVDEPGGLNDVATSWTAGHVASISDNGSLSYLTDPAVDTRPVLIDLSGSILSTIDLPKGRYSSVSVSPDGAQAVVVRQTTRTESTLWLINLARGGVTPLTVGRGQQTAVVWSPDSRRIVYMNDRDGTENLFTRDLAAGGPEEPFYRSPAPFKQPDSWTRDGKWIVFRQLDPDTFQNLWAIQTSGEAKPIALAQGPGRDLGGQVSPDGKWLAYFSDESGRGEIYLQPFPQSGGVRVPITTEGGVAVWWGKDSRSAVALSGSFDRLLAIDIEYGAGPRAKPPRRLGTLPRGVLALDIMPDRARFLALVPATTAPSSITVVQNWQRALSPAQQRR